MPALDSKLRSQLDTVCQQAREKAEEAARLALQRRAVDVAEPHAHFKPAEKVLRNRLRARGRQAGDSRNPNKTQSIEQLAQELAYEYWHRMLFARFLAENHLLMHPDGVAVSLAECDELAADEGAPNGFVLAARYASKMLPQVFRTDDVLLEIEFAPEHRLGLEKLLATLPRETFLADDSLGWVYQFWQTARKEQVNKTGNKIDSRTISSVTQLFTEDYMVQFLLHNTLGAWWCAKAGISGQGAGVKAGECPVALEYLRWRDDGTPAAGKFEGWPKTLKEFTLLDPCCGSGHFLVAAFNLLVPLRMHDEGVSAHEACDAVLRENLFGLELDPRCTQIAAFALAVAAWRYPDEDGQQLGFRELPPMNIACAGIGPQASEAEWIKFADLATGRIARLGRDAIRNGLENLHRLFSQAPTLGSLINPQELRGDVVSADFETLSPLFAEALAAEQDDDAHERAVAAAGMVKAAELLAGAYTLVITNVPYLGRGKQDDTLKQYLEQHYPNSKADLATAFIERCLEFCAKDGTTALVAPQNMSFIKIYAAVRQNIVENHSINSIAHLGTSAFETITGEVVSVSLLTITRTCPRTEHKLSIADIASAESPGLKAHLLKSDSSVLLEQMKSFSSPDWRFAIVVSTCEGHLKDVAYVVQGLSTGDNPQFQGKFWEGPQLLDGWSFLEGSTEVPCEFGGKEHTVWMSRLESVGDSYGAALRGRKYWGCKGVSTNRLGLQFATCYVGNKFDINVNIIIPKRLEYLATIYVFCASDNFNDAVRQIDKKAAVTNATVAEIPFDLAHWQQVASEKYPDGLPEPESDDPTQWLFHGRPESSTSPLQVAVARLLGYRWPAELDQNMRLSQQTRDLVRRCEELLSLADRDGLVPIPSVRGETPAAERVLELLQAAYGKKWSNSVLQSLLTEAGCSPGTTLDEWLRNAFFEQHCKLFQNRPFLWHIWDGRKDGFACLVNYHQLNHKALENLTYAYLKDWITAQAAQAKLGKTGADLRLAAAQALQDKLKLILTGEKPHDIFVRWKPLAEQAIGWHPDLNDGVRMNIRPFIEAGILRKNPNIKWTKDRGKEPQRDEDEYPWFSPNGQFTGDRVNDVHLTNAEKQKARDTMATQKEQR